MDFYVLQIFFIFFKNSSLQNEQSKAPYVVFSVVKTTAL